MEEQDTLNVLVVGSNPTMRANLDDYTMLKEKCTIEIQISDDYDRELGFELEDVVKNAWGHMVPWFTRRHGITNGVISLEDGAVTIKWLYEEDDS